MCLLRDGAVGRVHVTGSGTRNVIVLLVVFHSRWGLGSRRKATIDLSLPVHLYQPAVSNPHLTILVAMAFACLWSVLSPGILGCEPQEARAQDRRRCPTLAPSAVPRLQQEIKERLQHCHAAAAATAIITVVIHWLLLQHMVAFPPTSRRCYRSTANTRLIVRLLLVFFFLR